MVKMCKKNFLFLAGLLSIILIFTIYASTVPVAYAAESTIEAKGLAVLSDVVGVDLTEYDVVSRKHPRDSYLGAVSKEDMGYTLKSNESRLKLLCTFTDENLHILHVLEREGSPCLTREFGGVLEMATDFLVEYQAYTGDSFYGDLMLMLDDVDVDEDLTKRWGNVEFELDHSGNYTNFIWSYTSDGVDAARKCVALGYKDGFLKYFVDTWSLHEIGSTSIDLSEQEAIDIAMDSTRTFSWKVVVDNETFEINNFNVTKALRKHLVFGMSPNPDERGKDRLSLYPMWRIGVGLDKFYPGNVYGIYVDIRADTKEIQDVKAVSTNLDPNFIPGVETATLEESTSRPLSDSPIVEGAHLNSMWIKWTIIPVLSILVLKLTILRLNQKEDSTLSHPRTKSPAFRVSRIVICLLIVLMLLLPISMVVASNWMNRATIWGSEADPKTQEELALQNDICAYIADKFSANGYDATDYQGSNSVKATLLSSIDSSEANYPQVATVWFDHGVGKTSVIPGYPDEWHFMIMDSNGDPIYDYEIHDKTGRQKTFFAFISTCMSAKLDLINPTDQSTLGSGTYGENEGGSGEIIGMPYAWTHGTNITEHGYEDPDSSQFCYIGFPWGSPSLAQEIDPDNYRNVTYYNWTWAFFNYSLNYDMTINQALDHASYECFPPNYFNTTALYQNFTAVWEDVDNSTNCNMTVYGNGDLKLHQPQLTVECYNNYGQSGYVPLYIDGESVGYTMSAYNVSAGDHTLSVPSYYSGHYFYGWYYQGDWYSNPITVDVSSDRTVVAYYHYYG